MPAYRLIVPVLLLCGSALAADAPTTVPTLDELRQQEQAVVRRIEQIERQLDRYASSEDLTAAAEAREARAKALNDLRKRYEFRRNELTRELHEKAAQLSIDGMGTPGRISVKELELQNLMKDQFDAARNRDEASHAYKRAIERIDKGETLPAVDNEVHRDPDVRAARHAMEAAQRETGADGKALVAAAQKKLDEAIATVRARTTTMIIEGLGQAKEQAESQYNSIKERVDAAKADLGDLANAMNTYLALKNDEQATSKLLRQYQEQIDRLMFEEQTAPPADWQAKLEARRQQAQTQLREVQAALRDAEVGAFRQSFGNGPVSLFLTPQALAANEPSLKNVTLTGVTHLGGRTFLQFENDQGSWSVDPTAITGIFRPTKK